MENNKHSLNLNNHGLTLIELIAAIAIIGIFGAVIASFITSGMNFYRHASDTSNVQRNMQNTLESIENLVLDTNGTIKYQVDNVDAENDIGQDSQAEKLLVMKSVWEDTDGAEQQITDVLRWRPDEQKLYYVRNPQNLGTTDGQVLAEHVSGFSVDISKVKTEGIVRFQLSITKRGEEMTQIYTVALRNKVDIES